MQASIAALAGVIRHKRYAVAGTGLLATSVENEVEADNKKGHDMWVSKPIYESLPYFYLLSGAIALVASMYLNHWYWPTICFVVGLGSLVGGLVVLLKRRDHRIHDRRASDANDD